MLVINPPKPPSVCPQIRLNDYRMYKTLLLLKLLADAGDWQFLGKTILIFYTFFLYRSKNVPAPLCHNKCFGLVCFLIGFYTLFFIIQFQ